MPQLRRHFRPVPLLCGIGQVMLANIAMGFWSGTGVLELTGVYGSGAFSFSLCTKFRMDSPLGRFCISFVLFHIYSLHISFHGSRGLNDLALNEMSGYKS